MWLIQSILINRNIPHYQALQTAKKISNKTPLKIHKTVKYYRFRIEDPKDFTEFRTKIINNDIRIIFGYSPNLQGAGIFEDLVKQTKKGISKINKIFSKSSSYNNISTKTLASFGNSIITELNVVRTPIQKVISNALNLLTAGKFNELKSKYSFDKLFHLSLMANIGGKYIYIEKNEVVNISPSFTITDQSEIRNIPLNNQVLTINVMLQKTLDKIGNERFFTYDAFKNNCQDFIINILNTNNLGDPSIYAFVKQDISGILNELPKGLPKFARTITDIGAIVSRIRGEGQGGSQASGYIARLYASNKPQNKGKIYRNSKGQLKQPIQFKPRLIKKTSDNLLNTRIKEISQDFTKFVNNTIIREKKPYIRGLVDIDGLWHEYTRERLKEMSRKLKQKEFFENLQLEVPEPEPQDDYFGEFKPILIEEDFPKFIPKLDPYTGEYYMAEPSKPKTKKIIPKSKVIPEPIKSQELKVAESTPESTFEYNKPIKSFEYYQKYLENNKVPSAKDLMPLIQEYEPADVRKVENILNLKFGDKNRNIYKIGNNSIKGARSNLVKQDGTFTKSASNQNGNSLYIILNELQNWKGIQFA